MGRSIDDLPNIKIKHIPQFPWIPQGGDKSSGRHWEWNLAMTGRTRHVWPHNGQPVTVSG